MVDGEYFVEDDQIAISTVLSGIEKMAITGKGLSIKALCDTDSEHGGNSAGLLSDKEQSRRTDKPPRSPPSQSQDFGILHVRDTRGNDGTSVELGLGGNGYVQLIDELYFPKKKGKAFKRNRGRLFEPHQALSYSPNMTSHPS